MLNLGGGENRYTVTGILESENSSRIFTVWIPETAVDTGIYQAPYELRFRFEGSQVMEPERLRADIERFFSEMEIPADRTFTAPAILEWWIFIWEAEWRFMSCQY